MLIEKCAQDGLEELHFIKVKINLKERVILRQYEIENHNKDQEN